MENPQDRRAYWLLCGLVLLAIAYMGVLFYRHTLTGVNWIDGVAGVLLGLYICSRPAAHLVDLIIFGRVTGYRGRTPQELFRWVSLNLVVMLAGGIVIITGTTRLVLPH